MSVKGKAEGVLPFLETDQPGFLPSQTGIAIGCELAMPLAHDGMAHRITTVPASVVNGSAGGTPPADSKSLAKLLRPVARRTIALIARGKPLLVQVRGVDLPPYPRAI